MFSLSVMPVSRIFPPPVDLSVWFLASATRAATRQVAMGHSSFSVRNTFGFSDLFCGHFSGCPWALQLEECTIIYIYLLCAVYDRVLCCSTPPRLPLLQTRVIIHFLLLSLFHIRNFCLSDNPCYFFSLFYFCNIPKQYRNHDLYFILEGCWPLELFEW